MFVLVILRAVNVAVSYGEGREAGLNTCFRRGEIYAESEAGDVHGGAGKGESRCDSERT